MKKGINYLLITLAVILHFFSQTALAQATGVKIEIKKARLK